jgi:co-chaperonin GroES (HSP10)
MKLQISIQPIHDRVLIRELPPAQRKDGLIIIREHPDKKDFLSNDTTGEHQDVQRVGAMGVVVAVGPGVWDEKFKFHPTTLRPGEVVVFTAWDDLEGAIPGHVMVREGDIWGRANA